MITFTLCLLALIAGYFIYGRFIERVFSPDDRKTPALTRADGVLYTETSLNPILKYPLFDKHAVPG